MEESNLHFDGNEYLISQDREVPIKSSIVSSGPARNAYVDRFLQYINKLRNNGIFDKPNQNGLIIVADDQYVNQ